LTSAKPSSFIVSDSRKGALADNYLVGKKLGEGASGEVRLCRHRVTNEMRAVKFLNKQRLTEQVKADIMNECAILSELDHPNIVRLYEFYDEAEQYCLVQELVKGGDLIDIMMDRPKFGETEARKLIKALLACVNYCHKQGVVHRDLKPDNILLEANLDPSTMKVTDFGASFKNTKKFWNFKMTDYIGTVDYMAPEVIIGEYNEKCDIWSIGVIAYMLLTGQPPFFGRDDKAIISKVLKGDLKLYKFILSPEAKDFLQYLMHLDYRERPSAEKALSHPWMQQEKDCIDSTRAKQALSNISNFRADAVLKQATYAYMGSQLISK